jgi:hypothetical protein
MQNTSLLDHFPLWLLIWIIAALVLLLIEAGYGLGRYRRLRSDGEMEAP